MNREIEVFVDLDGTPHRVGRLWSRANKGRESASFEYDKVWLKSGSRFPLDPLLTIDTGTHHSRPGRPLFGAIGDSAPDRWGRALMRRAERKAAEREGRMARTLMEIDFLLMVEDGIRQGALRFRDVGTDEFLANSERTIPPLIELPRLLAASERVAEDRESDDDLRLLLAPGSSLGGARPKAAVVDLDGNLSIAKFPHSGDEYNVEMWSGVALSLAARAGVEVPAHRVAEVAGRQVLIVRRFDRAGENRLPFLSAMSMIGASDGDDNSYLEIVDALRRYGSDVARDMPQLWRRIVFGVLVSNLDDHLRNHGFLYDTAKGGWRLSPAYDINPVPIDIRPRVLSLMIDVQDKSASFDLALEVGDYFGLRADGMKVIAGEVASAVSRWREEAGLLGISNSEITRMASAFEHEDLRKAREYGNSSR